ncbi:MAG: polyprenol monophosphomannose synthase [Candidatus Nanopelagicales bacterium]|nr:polyprenol monophosphomannose synthase [Candidatus Nanopelagicales bacterium]
MPEQPPIPPRDAVPGPDPEGSARVIPLARPRPGPTLELTVLVPTRNEAGNVDVLIDRLGAALRGRRAEVLFVDDSDDDTPRRVLARTHDATPEAPALRVIHRPPDVRAGGLGTAVTTGLAAARGEWAVVMDGDLQHPPELVPGLVEAGRRTGADLVVASRRVPGGDAAGLDGVARSAVSGAATWLARAAFPRRLHGVTDPMSGFFAVRRTALDLHALRPDGFKILLEILVRSPGLATHEVGFTFGERQAGDSKASVGEGLRFARQVVRLSAARRAAERRARERRRAAAGQAGDARQGWSGRVRVPTRRGA